MAMVLSAAMMCRYGLQQPQVPLILVCMSRHTKDEACKR